MRTKIYFIALAIILGIVAWERFSPDARLCAKAGGHYEIGGSCGVSAYTYKEIKYK